MAEARVEQASPSGSTPSKITDFFTSREHWQSSPTTCVTDYFSGCHSHTSSFVTMPDFSSGESTENSEMITDSVEYGYCTRKAVDPNPEEYHAVPASLQDFTVSDVENFVECTTSAQGVDFLGTMTANSSQSEIVMDGTGYIPGAESETVFVSQHPYVGTSNYGAGNGQNIFLAEDPVSGLNFDHQRVTPGLLWPGPVSVQPLSFGFNAQNPVVYYVDSQGNVVNAFMTDGHVMPLFDTQVNSNTQNIFGDAIMQDSFTGSVYGAGYPMGVQRPVLQTVQNVGGGFHYQYMNGNSHGTESRPIDLTSFHHQQSLHLSTHPQYATKPQKRAISKAGKKLIIEEGGQDENADLSLSGPKKPRKGRGRGKAGSAKSGKTTLATGSLVNNTQPQLNGVCDPLQNSAISDSDSSKSELVPTPKSEPAPAVNSEPEPVSKTEPAPVLNSDSASRPKSATVAKPRREPAAKPKRETTQSKSKKAQRDEVEPQKPITAFFPVRRSDRRFTSKELKREKEKDMQEKILRGCEDGLEVKEIEGKGRGVLATRSFERDEFVVEYAGELVNITTAKQRENLYAKDEAVGCYMYYFAHKNKQYCIDATAESGKLGRLLNHSRKGNCHTKVVAIGDRPYLVLLASRHISAGEELTYDYGDRSQLALESHPWLKH